MSGDEKRGKMVAAHPMRVAQADQLAADEGAEVKLSSWLPPDKLYVIDLDALAALPDAPFVPLDSLPWDSP